MKSRFLLGQAAISRRELDGGGPPGNRLKCPVREAGSQESEVLIPSLSSSDDNPKQ